MVVESLFFKLRLRQMPSQDVPALTEEIIDQLEQMLRELDLEVLSMYAPAE